MDSQGFVWRYVNDDRKNAIPRLRIGLVFTHREGQSLAYASG